MESVAPSVVPGKTGDLSPSALKGEEAIARKA
jgi:hypothetical protein